MARPQHPLPHTISALVAALPGFVGGTALQLQQPELWPPTHYAVLLLGCLLCLALVLRGMPGGWQRGLIAVVCMAGAGFALTGVRSCVFQQGALQLELEGRDLQVTGVIAAMPQVNESGSRFRLRVEQATLEGRVVRLPALLYLGWYTGAVGRVGNGEAAQLAYQPPDLRAGERWSMLVRLKAPHGNRNPHGFDYELWLWEQGLQATGYVRAGSADPPPRRLAQTWRHPVEVLRQDVRERILQRVQERSVAGVLAALVVGDQNAIERADWDSFRAAGVAHLMSISGLHVTMFAWFAAALVGALWRRSAVLCLWRSAAHASIVGGLLLATAYALFSGWGVPSQRTIWMLLTVGLLRLSARRWPWPAVWLLACAVVVLVDPWALNQPGFWLSFVAVAVLFASGGVLPRVSGWSARLRAMLREQWVVTAALTPLSLLLFGQTSLVGLAANLLAIPWVTLLVTPLALAGVAVAPLWDLAAGAVALLVWYLQLLLQLPLASVSVAQAPLWAGVAGVAGGALLVLRLPRLVRAAGLPLMLPVLLWQLERPPAGEFDLLAADIGQGNAVLVRTASHALLYDAGPRFSRESDAGHRVLVPLLRALGVRLDRVVLSHRDSDHVGGASAVLAMQPGASVLSSIEAGHPLQLLRSATRCERGQQWQWDGVLFSILHPDAADYLGAPRPNTLSCVLRISSAAAPGRVARVALLTGDIERPQELRLLAAGAPLKADLLLVPHHGSKTSSSAEFLDAVAPAHAMLQSGYRNRFGHPAAEVRERYLQRQIQLVGSPQCGASGWRSWEAHQVQCQRQLGRRYWHHQTP